MWLLLLALFACLAAQHTLDVQLAWSYGLNNICLLLVQLCSTHGSYSCMHMWPLLSSLFVRSAAQHTLDVQLNGRFVPALYRTSCFFCAHGSFLMSSYDSVQLLNTPWCTADCDYNAAAEFYPVAQPAAQHTFDVQLAW
jgi:hypothetical protein